VANAAKASANSRSAVWKQLSSAEHATVGCWYCWTWPARVLCAAVSSEVAWVVLSALRL
jgi:hypothetical protein